jgi:NAD(P)-dependent dehydrogenase (short-subunit alcohol dehydrogenase family)
MTGRLAGKRAVLIGAGQSPGQSVGIGRSTALLFAREGAELLLVDKDRAGVDETRAQIIAAGGRATVHVADITDAASCARMADAAQSELGGVDVVFNSVGIVGSGSVTEVEEIVWDSVIETNLKSMWLVAAHLLPAMVEVRGGSFIAVSSIAAERGGNATAYAVSKAGINRLVRSIAQQYAQFDIRANAIMPGLIDTPMAIDLAAIEMGISRDELAAKRDAMVPMTYKGSPDDIAYAALFFASDESRYVSGTCLPVDGAVLSMR